MFELGLLPRSLDAALRDLGNPKPDVRLSALRDLTRYARSGEQGAASALLEALKDADEGVRAAAALGLADADVSFAVTRLLDLAENDVSTRVRQMALLALGELSAHDHVSVADALWKALSAEHAAERFQALLALHQLAPERAERGVIEGTVDPDPEVRRLSFRIAEANWSGRELPELVFARAKAALVDPSANVRGAAALLLAQFGDASGEAALLDLLSGKATGAGPDDEQAAIEAAAALELRSAIPLLERRAYSFFGRDPQGYHARIALARLGDERARAAILRGLEAWTFGARTLSVAAVGKAGLVEARRRLEAWLTQPDRADPAAVREALALLDAAEPSA
ncbi:MAG: HEAT repeat domain-containing protein [Polyangiaceae bacterium]